MSSRPDSRAGEAFADSRIRSMELGDGDPERWPRKSGEVSSKEEKALLPTPYLTPHPEESGVRATLCDCSGLPPTQFPHYMQQ
jgi:hypothetical protein